MPVQLGEFYLLAFFCNSQFLQMKTRNLDGILFLLAVKTKGKGLLCPYDGKEQLLLSYAILCEVGVI